MPIPRVNLLIRRKNWLAVAALLVLLGLTLVEWDEWRSTTRHEETVALAQLPAPVRAAIEQEAASGTVGEIDKVAVDGKTAYVADLLVNGKEQEIRIGEDGKVISRDEREAKHDD